MKRNALLNQYKNDVLTVRELIAKLKHVVSERDMDLPITFIFVDHSDTQTVDIRKQGCHFDHTWKEYKEPMGGSIEHGMYYHDTDGKYDESIIIFIDDEHPENA